MSVSLCQKLVLLFTTFFKISLFVVGGGLAMLPVIEEKFIRKNNLLKQDDILDMLVLTQTVPGLIAVNASVFVGNKIAGFLGAVTALFAVMLPSLIIIMIIAALLPSLEVHNSASVFAFSSIRACIAGVFIITAVRLFKNVVKNAFDFLIIASFLVALTMGINPAYVILISVPIGYTYIFLQALKNGRIADESKKG